jgi:hypothetical protein
MAKDIQTQECQQFLAEVKTRVLSSRVSAATAINRELMMLYWDIGRGIMERQAKLGWGKSVVETLAKDLIPIRSHYDPWKQEMALLLKGRSWIIGSS